MEAFKSEASKMEVFESEASKMEVFDWETAPPLLVGGLQNGGLRLRAPGVASHRERYLYAECSLPRGI